MSAVIPWSELEPYQQENLSQALDRQIPACVLVPGSVEELAALVAEASAKKQTILPYGRGSKIHWGPVCQAPHLVISTQKLNRIVEHAQGDLTVTVEAGVTLAQLQSFLAPWGQFLPLDPAYGERATLGGIVASADAGSWRQGYGGVRDLVLGLSFTRADGKVAKAGGKVVKNVAGYDLMKLFTGSYGTLAIITEITFRLYPLPQASQTVVISGEESAIALLALKLRSSSLTPTAAEIISPSLLPTPQSPPHLGLVVRFQSIEVSIQQQVTQLQNLAQAQGCLVSFLSGSPEAALWEQLANRIIIPSIPSHLTGKIGIIPTQTVSLLEKLGQLCPEQGLATVNLSTGVGRLQVPEQKSFSILRSFCQDFGGYLTLLEAPAAVKKELEPWGYQGNALTLMKSLKNKFDPDHILSPARFF